ncbi:hypothetical protein KDH_12800 [Dictyobacter sp. S3.2.2.5]|uniref:Uncharacterized protein n=1 Tax=Dictyobacter halimunensis TaxID=3026934 RepID=A0ABQ6FJN2_9CHLR|nr:hypothetical protein KDH_12800 [Dictyobacter sp. S3.2.2.5]
MFFESSQVSAPCSRMPWALTTREKLNVTCQKGTIVKWGCSLREPFGILGSFYNRPGKPEKEEYK